MTSSHVKVRDTLAATRKNVGRGAYPIKNHLPGACGFKTVNEASTDQRLKAPVSPFLQELFDKGNEFEEVVGGLLVDAWPGTVIDATTFTRTTGTVSVSRQKATAIGAKLKAAIEQADGPVLVVVDEEYDKQWADGTWVNGRFVRPEAHDRRMATTVAIAAGAAGVWGAILPSTPEWAGRPDLLLHDNFDDPTGYLPFDVKWHKVTEGESKETGWKAITLSRPDPSSAHMVQYKGRPHKVDAVQCAHYWQRMVQVGIAADTPVGGVIGKPLDSSSEQTVATILFDLDDKVLSIARRKTTPLDALEAAEADYVATLEQEVERATTGGPPADVPQKRSECDMCQWFENVCEPAMNTARSITLLLPGVTPARAEAHYAQGVTRVDQMASLHRRTAMLVDAGVHVPTLLEQARTSNPDAPALTLPATFEVEGEARTMLGGLTAGDVAEFDDRTAAYADDKVHKLTDAIDQARTADVDNGQGRVFHKAGVNPNTVTLGMGTIPLDEPVHVTGPHGQMVRTHVPEVADVELHIDMENDGDDLFQVGAAPKVSRRVHDDLSELLPDELTKVYWCAWAFDHLDDTDVTTRSLRVFGEFAERLRQVQSFCAEHELSLRVVYYTPAEYRVFVHHAEVADQLRESLATIRAASDPDDCVDDDGEPIRLPAHLTEGELDELLQPVPSVAAVDDWFESDTFFDLFKAATRWYLWPTRNHTLKSLAKYVRFSWSVDDPSGINAVLRYREALDANRRGDTDTEMVMRQWLWNYNKSDCLATVAVLDWLCDKERFTPDRIRAIESLDTDVQFETGPTAAQAALGLLPAA